MITKRHSANTFYILTNTFIFKVGTRKYRLSEDCAEENLFIILYCAGKFLLFYSSHIRTTHTEHYYFFYK